jgi:hypothetical protein
MPHRCIHECTSCQRCVHNQFFFLNRMQNLQTMACCMSATCSAYLRRVWTLCKADGTNEDGLNESTSAHAMARIANLSLLGTAMSATHGSLSYQWRVPCISIYTSDDIMAKRTRKHYGSARSAFAANVTAGQNMEAEVLIFESQLPLCMLHDTPLPQR